MAAQATLDVDSFNRATGNNAQLASLIGAINESPTLVNLINKYTSNPGNTIVIGGANSGTQVTGADGSFVMTVEGSQFTVLNPEQIAVQLGHEFGHAEIPGGLYSDYSPANPTEAAQFDSLAEGTAIVESGIIASELNAYNSSVGIKTTYSADIDDQLQAKINEAGPDRGAQIAAAGQYYASQRPSIATSLTYTQFWEDAYVVRLCATNSTLNQAGINGSTINWQSVTPDDFKVNNTPGHTDDWLVNASGILDKSGDQYTLSGGVGTDGKLFCSISRSSSGTASLTDYLTGSNVVDVNSHATIYVESAAMVAAENGFNTFNLTDNSNTDLTVAGKGNIVSSNGNSIHLLEAGTDAQVAGDRNLITMDAAGQTLSFSASSKNVSLGDQLLNEVVNGDAIVSMGDGNGLAIHGQEFLFVDGGDDNTLYLDGASFGGAVTLGDGNNVTLDGGIGFVSLTASNGTVTVRNEEGFSLIGSGNRVDGADASEVNMTGNANVVALGHTNLLLNGDNNEVTLGDGSTVSISGGGTTLSVNGGQISLYDATTLMLHGNGDSMDYVAEASTDRIVGDRNSFNLNEGSSVTVAGSENNIGGYDGTLSVESGSSNNINTSNSIINLAGGVSASLLGGDNTVDAGAGVMLTVSGDENTLSMDGGAVEVTSDAFIISVTGSGNVISGSMQGQVQLTGDGNDVALSGAQINLTGDDVLISSSGNKIIADNADISYTGSHVSDADIDVIGDGDVIHANGASILLDGTSTEKMTVVGTENSINGSNISLEVSATAAGSTNDIAGHAMKVSADSGSYILSGYNNELHAVDGTAVHVSGAGNTIYVNDAVINLDDGVGVDIVGSGNTIVGGSGDSVYVVGSTNSVAATNSVIDFAGDNTGDTVRGAGNDGSNWSTPDPDLPTGDNGGYTPPSGVHLASEAALYRPDAQLLAHSVAAFHSGGSSGASDTPPMVSACSEHLHLSVAA